MATLRPTLIILIFLTLVTGGVYPLVTTVLGQWWFQDQATGSLIRKDGEVRGSQLIGQMFSSAAYFHGRPSATADTPYNPEASGGSNLAASNPELDKVVAMRVAQLRQANPQANPAVPVELVTASASGLDYSLTQDAVLWQIPRVAKARNLSSEALLHLVRAHTETPLTRVLGQPIVNIVELNMALDGMQQQ